MPRRKCALQLRSPRKSTDARDPTEPPARVEKTQSIVQRRDLVGEAVKAWHAQANSRDGLRSTDRTGRLANSTHERDRDTLPACLRSRNPCRGNLCWSGTRTQQKAHCPSAIWLQISSRQSHRPRSPHKRGRSEDFSGRPLNPSNASLVRER